MGAYVFFIDSLAADNETLIASFDPAVRYCRLDATADGFSRMANTPPGGTDIAGLHHVSHGNEGILNLGSTLLKLARGNL